MILSWIEMDQALVLKFSLVLLHFVWQGSAIGLVAWWINSQLTASPQWRYRLNLVALLCMAASPIVTFQLYPANDGARSSTTVFNSTAFNSKVLSSTQSVSPAEQIDTRKRTLPDGRPAGRLDEATSANVQGEGGGLAFANDPAQRTGRPQPWRRVLASVTVYVYLSGVLLMLLRFSLALRGGQHLRACAKPLYDSDILTIVQTQARALGLQTRPAIACCERVVVPVVVGILKPTILLPASALSGLSAQETEAILIHELAHIRRNDLLVNLFQRLIEATLFFHPAVWYVSRTVSRQRELCCDDMVLASGVSRLRYASSLVRMAELCHPFQTTSQAVGIIAASGGSEAELRSRVQRLLGEPNETRLRLSRIDWLLTILLGCLVTLPAFAAGTSLESTAQESSLAKPESTNTKSNQQQTGQPAATAPRVLVLEDWRQAGDFQPLTDLLNQQKYHVDVRNSGHKFLPLEELKNYDAVVLADVARSTGDYSDSVSWISDEDLESLTAATREFGTGLIVIGGPNSFGPGGWSGTRLEEALPVDCKSEQTQHGALVLMMHPAELSHGNSWQRIAARAAASQLGVGDYLGVIVYGPEGTAWLWEDDGGLTRIGDKRQSLLDSIAQSRTGDFPDFRPPFEMALEAMEQVDAPVKQMIVLTDADPFPPTPATLTSFRKAKIPVSVVHIDLHGPKLNRNPQRFASITGGRYYLVRNSTPEVLERIFAREARSVSSTLIRRSPIATNVVTKANHNLLAGITALPSVEEYVETELKSNPLAQAPLTLKNELRTPILASWNYGVGRSVVVTSNPYSQWNSNWVDDASRDRLVTNVVKWAMRQP